MRIACPACNAAYQVPDEQLGEGRIVRCARCGTDWAPIEAIPATVEEPSREREPVPEAPVPAPLPEPELIVEPRRVPVEEEIPIPRPLPAPPKPVAAKRGGILLVLAWIVSLGLVAAAVTGLYVGRERVMKTWPPSVRAYASLGLAAHPASPSEGRE